MIGTAVAVMLSVSALAACDQVEESVQGLRHAVGTDRWGEKNPAELRRIRRAEDQHALAMTGARLIVQYGCDTCHTIPGIETADALVGPPLNLMAKRIYIAGLLRNTPSNMETWLKDPQAIVPGNAMPNLGLSDREAEAITAYLYTLGADRGSSSSR